MDLAELRARAQKGLPLYGQSDQPEWIQQAAHSNSAFSQLKFCESIHLNPQNTYLTCACSRFPNVRFLQPFRESLTNRFPGSTSSTTHITVQTSLSTSNDCTNRTLRDVCLHLASFPLVLLLIIHVQLVIVLRQFVHNALPHCVVDCLGFSQLYFELGYFYFQFLHPGICREWCALRVRIPAVDKECIIFEKLLLRVLDAVLLYTIKPSDLPRHL